MRFESHREQRLSLLAKTGRFPSNQYFAVRFSVFYSCFRMSRQILVSFCSANIFLRDVLEEGRQSLRRPSNDRFGCLDDRDGPEHGVGGTGPEIPGSASAIRAPCDSLRTKESPTPSLPGLSDYIEK